MAVLALSPLHLGNWLGLVWLTPFFLALYRPQPLKLRVQHALLTAGLPALYVLGGSLPQATSLSLLGILLIILPFILAAALTPQQKKCGPLDRLTPTALIIASAMALLRECGMPTSLALLTPIEPRSAAVVRHGGILLLDGLILALQLALIRVCCQLWQKANRRSLLRSFSPIVIVGALLMFIAPLPANHVLRTTTLAVVQTANPPGETLANPLSTASSDSMRLEQTLSRLQIDWAIWPESSHSFFIPPREWARANQPFGELRHGYAYMGPGRLRSLVTGETSDDGLIRIEKQRPLPFTESALIQPEKPQPPLFFDDERVSILICSDALIPKLLRQERLNGTRLIITPANSDYLGSGTPGRLQRKAVHLQGIRHGLPVIYVANGGPSTILKSNGDAARLLPENQAAVATLHPPLARQETLRAQPLVVLISMAIIGILAAAARAESTAGAPAPESNTLNAWHWFTASALALGLIISGLPQAALESHSQSHSVNAKTASLETKSHQAAIAGIAQRFGVSVLPTDIQKSGEMALRWLCNKTALLPRASLNPPPRPPALGLMTVGEDIQIVHWDKTATPYRLNLQDGGARPIKPDNPAIHWLFAVDTPEDCHSAESAWQSINGTRRPSTSRIQ